MSGKYEELREELKKLISEEELYRAVYWAVRDFLEDKLASCIRVLRARNPDLELDRGTLLLNVIYRAVHDAVYRAFREILLERARSLPQIKREEGS